MARPQQITVDGKSFPAQRGELLLDAALKSGIDLPFDCRAGHCGACCLRVISGKLVGGNGSEPGIVHACQSRIAGSAELQSLGQTTLRSIDGVLNTLRPLSLEVLEVGIRIDRTLPHHAGQYAQVRFDGYPSRPYSITHPLHGGANGHEVCFHIRRVEGGRLSSALGTRVLPGHRVSLTGPYGSAHFRPTLGGRLVLVATNTGFAPIWAIAVAALRENPMRRMMIIVGGRTLESLYMGAALTRLTHFPNVLVVPVCSGSKTLPQAVMHGRPTDYLPRLLPTDVLYTCGAPGMVDAVKAIAAKVGAICHADPFTPSTHRAFESDILGSVSDKSKLLIAQKPDRSTFDTPINAPQFDHGYQCG